jgi:hypothetical protein
MYPTLSLLDLVSILIVSLCAYCWAMKEVPTLFVYEAQPEDTDELRHRSLEGSTHNILDIIMLMLNMRLSYRMCRIMDLITSAGHVFMESFFFYDSLSCDEKGTLCGWTQ